MPLALPPLPYAYGALEPTIDELTMRIHHDKHHGGYVAALNAALGGTAWADRPVEELLSGAGLAVTSTANQDSPLMRGHTPLLCVDVWEHAYHLRYQHRRAHYLEAWRNVVDWQRVAARYTTATSPNAGGAHP